jgi:hypothetical protein
MNSTISYGVGMKTTITFGRMNPPTRGHEKLIDKVKELAGDGEHHVFTSQTHDKKRNPLSPEQKGSYMQSSFPDTNIHSQPSPFHALTHLQDKGYKDVTVVVGADRVSEFERIGSHKDFNFDNYNVVSAGERQGGEIENISASGARTAAKEKRYGDFSSMTPTLMSKKQSRQMFSDLHTQMEEFNLTEELFADQEELDLFYEAFLPMKYLFEQDAYTAQNMAMDTMRGGADYGEENQDRDRKRIDRQASRRQSETNPWPELLVIRNAQDNKIRIIPKADFDPGFQEILVGNMPGSPPMGEITPQIAFSVMQEPDFEASKTSNRLLKMFGVTDPKDLDVGSSDAPGNASGAPASVGGEVISPMGEMPRLPEDGRIITDPASTHPDWDHQPRQLIGGAVMAWNMATGRNPMDGGVSPDIAEIMNVSETLGPAAMRFNDSLMSEIPPDYVAYDNTANLGQLTPEWTENGGQDAVPKADLVFMNPATNDFIRANVTAGKQQLMPTIPGEATTLFNTMSTAGMITPFTNRKEVKKVTADVKTKLTQSLSALEDKGSAIKEGKEDIFSEATKIYDEISGRIEDLISVDKSLQKSILREVMTGELKFGPESTATATHVIATNKDGTNTQVQLMTDSYFSKLARLTNVNIYFAPANIEERIETQETDGDTFIDYLRALTSNMEDSLELDDLSFQRRDYEANSDFSLDGAGNTNKDLVGITDPFGAVKDEPESADFSDIQTRQNLRTMTQQAIEGFNSILDVMRFFSIGVEAIHIDPINLTVMNDKKADTYNIITVNGKRFRVPVERDAEDIMDDYNYIDAAFRECILEERKVRDYDDEYKKYHSKPEQRENRSKRVLARRKMKKAGKVKSKQDVGHKTALRNGGSNDMDNLKAQDVSSNRSDNGHQPGEAASTPVTEEHGAGDIGTMSLLMKYLKDTPFATITGYKPKTKSCGCPDKDKKETE